MNKCSWWFKSSPAFGGISCSLSSTILLSAVSVLHHYSSSGWTLDLSLRTLTDPTMDSGLDFSRVVIYLAHYACVGLHHLTWTFWTRLTQATRLLVPCIYIPTSYIFWLIVAVLNPQVKAHLHPHTFWIQRIAPEVSVEKYSCCRETNFLTYDSAIAARSVKCALPHKGF